MRVPLNPPSGLVSDETTYAAPGTWADGEEVRFYRGKPQPTGGFRQAFPTPLTGMCRNAFGWTDNSGQQNLAFGTHSHLFVLKDGTLADITPSGLTPGNIDDTELGYGSGPYGDGPYGGGPNAQFYPRTWSFANFGEYLMASPRGETLFVWQNNVGLDATVITQAPDHIGSMLVTPQRQVMAFGCEEVVSGTYNGMTIRWSHFQNYTSWTPATSNSAGEYTLADTGSRIVAARLLGNYIGIWTDTSVWLGTYVGSASQIYRFDRIEKNCGLAAANAVTVIDQVAYWLTPDLRFYAWQVGLPPKPVTCPIEREFKENVVVEQIDKVVSTSLSEFGEVWWHYPDLRDGVENSRAVFLNLADGSWSKSRRARTATIDSGPQRYPVFVSPTGVIYYHENGKDADGEPLTGFIRSSDQYFDNAQRRLLLKNIWPDFEAQQGDIAMTIRYRAHPQATERTKGPIMLQAGRSKRDFLADGAIFSIEFAWNSAPAFWRAGLPTFEVVATGAQ